MKPFLFLALFIFIFQQVTGQEFAEGYYVTMEKDTVACKVKIGGKKISSSYYNLVIQREGEENTVYKAKDRKIAAYGFNVLGERADFRYVDIEKTNDGGFFRQIAYGPNYLLYLHMVSTTVNGVVTTLPHYMVFKPDGTHVELTTHLLGNWKKNLKKILSDQPEALLALEEIGRNDIPDFIQMLNKNPLSLAK